MTVVSSFRSNALLCLSVYACGPMLFEPVASSTFEQLLVALEL
jgi:hypothetical protein